MNILVTDRLNVTKEQAEMLLHAMGHVDISMLTMGEFKAYCVLVSRLEEVADE